jgi:hypothetical protein
MKSDINWKVMLTLIFLTTISCMAKAQIYNGDSSKRLIIIVRPGSNYDNSGGTTPSTDNGSSTTTTTQPAYPDPDATSTKLNKPAIGTSDDMDQTSGKPVSIKFIPGDKKVSHKGVGGDTSGMNRRPLKKDTVYITKVDTINTTTPRHQSNKILFLELGGPGLAISLNYDQRFSTKKTGLGFRVGMGYFGDGGNTVFTIPLQLNYLLGNNGKFFEFGAGTTFLNTTGDNTGKTFIFDRVTGFIGTATIGVRYEPAKSLNFRLAFVPIFAGPGEGVIPAGGFSIGYTF